MYLDILGDYNACFCRYSLEFTGVIIRIHFNAMGGALSHSQNITEGHILTEVSVTLSTLMTFFQTARIVLQICPS